MRTDEVRELLFRGAVHRGGLDGLGNSGVGVVTLRQDRRAAFVATLR